VIGGHGPLHAWVSISSDYTRSLIIDALGRRKHMFTFLANNELDAPSCATVAASSTDATAAPASTEPWPVNLNFCEFERIDWANGLSSSSASGSAKGPLIVSSYPVRKGLIRKAQLSFLLRKFAAKRPDSILHKTIPETHIMTVDDPEYLEEALNDVYEVRDMIEGQDMWIMKASMVNQALGIHIITSVRDVERIIQDAQYEEIREWVMQRYIQRPLLLNGCKFHIRVYVLAVGNLTAYMWDQMLVLIAMEKYDRDVLNRSAHITNTCANSDHPDFVESEQIKLLSEILPAASVAAIHEQMRLTLRDLFAALHSEPTVFLPVPNGFELYGVDFLIDEHQGVWFLEANAGPDFAMTGDRLHKIVRGMMEQTFKLAIDPLVQAACDKEGVTIDQPTVAEQAQIECEESELVGQFVKCYEVLNSATVTMNFY
jgi:tubulin--tyrosine ligase